MQDLNALYKDMAARTNHEVYIGVVGPVRTGKSTFIKRFMELMVLPVMQNTAAAARAKDELPQSAAGCTIMTTEPKFIPEHAVEIQLENGVSFRTRLVDCVGYMVQGAMGNEENDRPRMVRSPWYEEEVPFEVAAQTGTDKVIREHATVGVLVTTDGSIGNLPRIAYETAEKQVVEALKACGKPFVILLNCIDPLAESSIALATRLAEEYKETVLPINCDAMTQETILGVLKMLLYAFPVKEIAVCMPTWLPMLEADHPLRQGLFEGLRTLAQGCKTMKDVCLAKNKLPCEACTEMQVLQADLGSGNVIMMLVLQPDLFYKVLSDMTGLAIENEAALMPCVLQMARVQKQYQRISAALQQAQQTGYGIVMPEIEELQLQEPELIHQNGRSGVCLRASAPSLHIMRATISTEISPIVGGEKQSENLVSGLMKEYEEDPIKIWESNIFGKSLHELVNEGLQAKLNNMPHEARMRMQETLERVINEGCAGLLCIIL